jgi:hypothetical protein
MPIGGVVTASQLLQAVHYVEQRSIARVQG